MNTGIFNAMLHEGSRWGMEACLVLVVMILR